MDSLIILEDGIPTFSPELKSIPVFYKIVKRNKGSEGDIDGRKKILANKELAYIYFMYHHKSPYVLNYSENVREQVVRRRLQMPEKWEPDQQVLDAIEVFKEDKTTPISKSLIESKEALFICTDLVKLLRKKIEESINKSDLQNKEIDEALKDMDRLLNISNKLPAAIKMLKQLEEEYGKELGKEKTKRAGREIGEFER